MEVTYPSRQFDALRDFNPISLCQSCEGARRLYIRTDFDLGAESADCEVLDVFHESLSWEYNGHQITFWPFLVALRPADNETAFWLPYWHTDEYDGKLTIKAGQFAPYMNAWVFESLVSQARQKGYLQ